MSNCGRISDFLCYQCAECQEEEPAPCATLGILKALPSASEEQIPRATAMLQGRFICGECATNHFGEDEPCPCHEDHPGSPACGFWTQRDKEA